MAEFGMAPSPATRAAATVGAAGLGAAVLALAFNGCRRQPGAAETVALMAGMAGLLALVLVAGWRSPADVIEEDLKRLFESSPQ